MIINKFLSRFRAMCPALRKCQAHEMCKEFIYTYLDTSIIIEYLRKQKKTETVLYRLYQTYDEIFVSAVTEFEVFSGSNPKNKDALQQIFDGLIILPFNSPIAQRASQEYQRLKTKNQRIEMRDLFIGVTAIVHNFPLATLNVEHFKRLKDLAIKNT